MFYVLISLIPIIAAVLLLSTAAQSEQTNSRRSKVQTGLDIKKQQGLIMNTIQILCVLVCTSGFLKDEMSMCFTTWTVSLPAPGSTMKAVKLLLLLAGEKNTNIYVIIVVVIITENMSFIFNHPSFQHVAGHFILQVSKWEKSN